MKKRIASFIMAITMITSLFVGCSSGKAKQESLSHVSQTTNEAKGMSYNGIDVSEPVTLTMYLLGEKSKDFDMVYEEINKKLKEKLNTTVNVQFLSWAEHDTKYSLLFSGGEDFDLIFTASTWGHYEETSAMGGFYPLTTDFIQKYAPDIYKVVPEVAWDQAMINGEVYMVPNYQNEFGTESFAVRGDLMEKYGYSDITSYDQLIEFFEKVAVDKDVTGISPLGSRAGMIYQFFDVNGIAIVPGSPAELFYYNTQDPKNLSINYLLDSEMFDKYAREMKDYFDKGFWSKDSLATVQERQDAFLQGSAAAMAWNLGSVERYAEQANAEHPEWKATLVDIVPEMPKAVNSYINNGMSINVASKKKERAMMVLNEFYTNPEINDLTVFGIEGVHWTAVGDDQYTETDKSSDYGIDANCNWGWTNMEIKRIPYNENPTIVDIKHLEILDSWNSNIKTPHIYEGFAFDSANVTSEMAAVSSIVTQYYNPVVAGMAGDVDTAVAELKKQLDNAGIQKIYDEFKRQAEEYVKSKQ